MVISASHRAQSAACFSVRHSCFSFQALSQSCDHREHSTIKPTLFKQAFSPKSKNSKISKFWHFSSLLQTTGSQQKDNCLYRSPVAPQGMGPRHAALGRGTGAGGGAVVRTRHLHGVEGTPWVAVLGSVCEFWSLTPPFKSSSMMTTHVTVS